MIILNGERLGCESCIRGHRAAGCLHTKRWLCSINSRGRPPTNTESIRFRIPPDREIVQRGTVTVEPKPGNRPETASTRNCLVLHPMTLYTYCLVNPKDGFEVLTYEPVWKTNGTHSAERVTKPGITWIRVTEDDYVPPLFLQHAPELLDSSESDEDSAEPIEPVHTRYHGSPLYPEALQSHVRSEVVQNTQPVPNEFGHLIEQYAQGQGSFVPIDETFWYFPECQLSRHAYIEQQQQQRERLEQQHFQASHRESQLQSETSLLVEKVQDPQHSALQPYQLHEQTEEQLEANQSELVEFFQAHNVTNLTGAYSLLDQC